VKRKSLAIVVVASLLALSVTGCAITNLLKKEVSERVEEVVSEEAEEVALAEGEAKAEAAKAASPTKPPAAAKPTKAPSPTATAEPEEEGPLSLVSAQELDSYSQVVRMSGTHGDEEWGMEMVTEFVREPPAQRYVMRISDETGEETSFEMIQVGDTTYIGGGPEGEWMSMTSSESPDLSDTGFIRLEDTFYSDECKYKGRQTVNGLQTKHYHCSEKALLAMPNVGGGVIQDAEGDVWVSTKYNVAVRFIFSWKGKDEDGVAVEGRWESDVTDINKPIKIEAPEGVAAAGLPDDIPMIDGARDVNAMMGIVTFIVDKPVKDVTAYYQSAMPKNGWTPEEGAMMPNMLSFSKGDRMANFMLSEEGSTTQVTIMVNEE